MPSARREPLVLLAVGGVLLVLSGIGPYDRLTWWMEVAPILIALPVLFATYARFPLTPLAYRLIFVHAVILMVGGHYTYARVPLGYWVMTLLGLARNHYDRLGHLAQGFIPAILAREVLVRTGAVARGRWLWFLVPSVCLAISACYEFVEWWAAALVGGAAIEFLGTQGDPWDTQWDMFLALVGSIAALAFLSKRHDREMDALTR